MDKSQNVKVAVRIRPFNKREKELNCKLVVDMEGNTTKLVAFNGEAERSFTFDYSFWSFDQFVEKSDGYLEPSLPKYADQKTVFQRMGTGVLNNAFAGYNCSLFAYGQTGSGKSYSMIGYGPNKGIVPITCDEIFKRTGANKDPNLTFDVKVSMLQIYNEVIQDLLIPIPQRPGDGLKIRESPQLGVYVDGAKKVFVTSFEAVTKVMDEGTKNRTVAATQMNATSSRAHTIITIEFTQIMKAGGASTQKLSLINLIDLAGSERQSKTQAEGQRLKQAVGINLSLTTLGQVISALAENSSGKSTFVPYRNSALTRVLQNALGGNSQTIMICAISPASDNYDEILSTLRYADQAKKIKNKPVVNESQTDKLIKNLKEENEKLKKMLAEKGLDAKALGKATDPGAAGGAAPGGTSGGTSGGTPAVPQLSKEDEEMIRNARALQKKLKDMDKSDEEKKAGEKKMLDSINKEKEEMTTRLKAREEELKKAQEELAKLKSAEMKKADESGKSKGMTEEELKQYKEKVEQELLMKIANEKKDPAGGKEGDGGELLGLKDHRQTMKGTDMPYFTNVSKDDSISKQIRIYCSKLKTTVGKKTAKEKMDIMVSGSDVKVYHCAIVNDQGKCVLVPGEPGSESYVNGKLVAGIAHLFDMDRVVFGWNSCFIFRCADKTQRAGKKQPEYDGIDWGFFKREMPVDIDQDDDEEGGCCSLI